MNITKEQIKKLWLHYATVHQSFCRSANYYQGKHSFLRATDRHTQNDATVNFIDYILDTHTALNTSEPFQIVLPEDATNSTSVEQYEEVRKANNVDTLDTQHFLNSLIFGYSVELQSVTNGEIKLKKYDPREWAFAFTPDKEIKVAVHKSIIEPNTILDGEWVEKQTIIFTVYTEESISVFREKEGELSLEDETANLYGRVPITLYYSNEHMKSFITDNLASQNNTVNRLVNGRMDEIEYTNSILALMGFELSDVNLEKLDTVVAKGRMIMPPNSDLKWIAKQNDTEKYRQAIDDAREFLFMQGKLPDRKDVQGAIGSQSGEAIKFLYQNTLQQAESFQRFIKLGIRDRIDLLNIIWKFQKKPLLLDYEININVSLPIDLRNIADTVNALKDVISHKSQLAMIPGIDPEQEMERLSEQSSVQVAAPESKQPIAEPPQARAQRREQVTAKSAESLSNAISAALDARRKAVAAGV